MTGTYTLKGGDLPDGTVVADYVLDGGTKTMTVTFNDKLGSLDGRNGEGGFYLEFEEDIFEEDIIQKLEFGEPVNKTFYIKRNSDHVGSIISKSGKPNKTINADAIEWQIDINTKLDSLTNVIIEDDTPDGLELKGAIEVYHLKVGLNGALTEGEPLEGEFPGFPISLNSINTAYRIKYTTKIVDEDKSPYENTAILNSNGFKIGESTVTVGNSAKGSDIEKRVKKPGKNANEITWEIDVNKGQKQLIGVILEDEPITPGLTVNPGTIEIYQLNNNNGEWTKGSKVEGIEILGGFPLELGNLEGVAYRIIFDTDIEYTSYKEINEFENKAILNITTTDDNGEKQ